MKAWEDNSFAKRKQNLLQQMDNLTKENVMLAFSGGVDSSLLLKLACEAAKKNGTSVYAVTANTKLHPAADLDIAKKVAREAGAVHKIVFVDELAEAGIENNPKNRCYLCKKTIFNSIKRLANELGIHEVMEGTNEDDLHVYRPGIKALQELDILSPLAENGLTKKDVRALAKEVGVPVFNRPSSPCLATRLPYGTKLDYQLLDRIEQAEKFIRELGFYNVRVRVHENIARIEVDKVDFEKIIVNKEILVNKMKSIGFAYITLDLEGFRSGSMDL